MNNEIRELKNQIQRLKTIAIDLKVDLNISEARIRDLENQVLEAHKRERGLMLGTQTMNKLEILGNSDDDNGQDPRATGRFKNPWEGVQ